VTCHDGFTLRDLVSYNDKHNAANGEENRDGASDNLSWNCGVEGPTEDPAINALRGRKQRNFLATLLLSQGVPMLLAGDEWGHSQDGNNNAYCQDSAISWLNWDLDDGQQALLRFTRSLVAFWKSQPALQRRRFFHGREYRGAAVTDIQWFGPSGAAMTDADWQVGFARCLGCLLRGENLDVSEQGETISGDTLLVLFNADHAVAIDFTLPSVPGVESWSRAFDTILPNEPPTNHAPGSVYPLPPCALAVFTAPACRGPASRQHAAGN
jgi:glycogen operon protein